MDRAHQRALDCFRERVREWEDRIEASVVKKDEFADLFVNAVDVIIQTTYQEKIEAAVNIIMNGCLREGDSEKLRYDELDHFTRCLQSLSIGALRTIPHVLDSTYSKRVDLDQLSHRLMGLNRDLCLGFLRELESFHLVYVDIADSQQFGPRTVRIYISELGVRFHKHILSVSETIAGGDE